MSKTIKLTVLTTEQLLNKNKTDPLIIRDNIGNVVITFYPKNTGWKISDFIEPFVFKVSSSKSYNAFFGDLWVSSTANIIKS